MPETRIRLAAISMALVMVTSSTDRVNGTLIEGNTPMDDHSEGTARFLRIIRPVAPAPNIQCVSVGGLSGTCYNPTQCLRLSGIGIGRCALGYGTCCIFPRSCDGITNQNLTYFTNPGYPNGVKTINESLNCSLTIMRKPYYNICQIRLDFEDFEVARPILGNCDHDKLLISGQNGNSIVPPICGKNKGQHIYFDVDRVLGPFTVRIVTKGPGVRKWNIRITQIECNNPNKAPANCLQYFKGAQGIISSFNYEEDSLPHPYQGYLNNLDYSICFKKMPGHCSMTYRVNVSADPFVIANTNSLGRPTVGNREAGVGVAECPDDYLLLGGLRYCGLRLNPSTAKNNPVNNDPVTDTSAGPFIARFVSNNVLSARGFKIHYQQHPCNKTANRNYG